MAALYPEGKSREGIRMRGRKIVEPTLAKLLLETPEWAKPLVAAAIHQSKRRP